MSMNNEENETITVSVEEYNIIRAKSEWFDILDPVTKQYLCGIGSVVCFSTRMNKQGVGKLAGVIFKPDQICIDYTEEITDYMEKKVRKEQRLTWRDFSTINALDFIGDVEELPMKEL